MITVTLHRIPASYDAEDFSELVANAIGLECPEADCEIDVRAPALANLFTIAAPRRESATAARVKSIVEDLYLSLENPRVEKIPAAN